MPEYWIGMFFPIDAVVPDGFEYVDMEPLEYAVCYLYDKENSGDFYTMEPVPFRPYSICILQTRSKAL